MLASSVDETVHHVGRMTETREPPVGVTYGVQPVNERVEGRLANLAAGRKKRMFRLAIDSIQ
jgi:hypothetical protein